MIKKPEIVFTFPACMGGVASFNFNIINYSKLIGDFHSRVILIKTEEDSRPLFKEKFKADEVVNFTYSNKDNQYNVQKRLARCIGNSSGALVTDNSISVYAARRFDTSKTIYHLLHDQFYVDEAMQLKGLVDISIAHSSYFSDLVLASNPSLFKGRTFHIPYGVMQKELVQPKNNKVLKLVFLGRLDKAKGVMLLFNINKKLQERNIPVEWNIIGKGPLRGDLREQWSAADNIVFHEPDTTEAVYDLLSSQDIFIFPASFEGTPVSILECLASGVVCIANDLPGGIRDILTEEIGVRCAKDDVLAFVKAIERFHYDRIALRDMQENCLSLAHHSYDISRNADNYFKLFAGYNEMRRNESYPLPKLSRLDRPGYPGPLVKLLRTIK